MRGHPDSPTAAPWSARPAPEGCAGASLGAYRAGSRSRGLHVSLVPDLRHPFLPPLGPKLAWLRPYGKSSSGVPGKGWATEPAPGRILTPGATCWHPPSVSTAVPCRIRPQPCSAADNSAGVRCPRSQAGGTGGGYRVTRRGPTAPRAQKGLLSHEKCPTIPARRLPQQRRGQRNQIPRPR